MRKITALIFLLVAGLLIVEPVFLFSEEKKSGVSKLVNRAIGKYLEKKSGVIAVITQATGKLEILRFGQKRWESCRAGVFLRQGDRIRTGANSRAVLIFSNGAEVKVNQFTEFALESSELGATTGRDKIRMKKGQISCGLRVRKGLTQFSVQTPVAVAAVRGTEFDTKVNEDGNTSIFVIDGVVQVENEFGSVELKKNQITSVTAGNAPEPPREATEVEVKSHSDWHKDIKIEEKILNLKIKTEKGEEKTLKLKFRK